MMLVFFVVFLMFMVLFMMMVVFLIKIVIIIIVIATRHTDHHCAPCFGSMFNSLLIMFCSLFIRLL